MWFMREREKILDIFEMTSGARLTCNYMRIGGVAFDLPESFGEEVRAFIPAMRQTIDDGEALLSGNEIFIARARNVAVVPHEMAINASLSGPMLRGSGVAWDIRKADPYCGYEQYDFEIPIGYQGDAYDRFIIRIEEMRQSLKIVEQALDALPGGPHSTEVPLALRPPAGRPTLASRAPAVSLATTS